jgi:hypothetical protein
VTQGNPQQAQMLCDRFEAPFPVWLTRNDRATRRSELKRGTVWQVPARHLSARHEAARKGHHIERAIGDVMQLPGTFIIDRE